MNAKPAELRVGQRVYYVLSKAPRSGRPQPLYLQVEILNITDKRVVVHNVKGRQRNHRAVKASKLVMAAPDGAWVE